MVLNTELLTLDGLSTSLFAAAAAAHETRPKVSAWVAVQNGVSSIQFLMEAEVPKL